MVWPLAILRSYASVFFIRWSGKWLKTAAVMGYVDPFVKLDVACKNHAMELGTERMSSGLDVTSARAGGTPRMTGDMAETHALSGRRR
ncbi:MAG: hypothetical protein ACUVX1_04335 [Chloroflexota bacterium]